MWQREKPSLQGSNWRRMAARTGAVAVAFAAGFWVGGNGNGRDATEGQTAVNGDLSAALKVAQHRLDNLRQQVMNSDIAARIDRESLEHVRQTMVRQQQELTRVRKELELYRSLLKDDQRADGLYIDQLRISPGLAGAFAYRLIVHQKAAIPRDVSTALEVRVVGDRGGQPVTYRLDELDPALDAAQLTATFKYFHVIEGQLQLPPDFMPRQVMVAIRRADGRRDSREATFNWLVENT